MINEINFLAIDSFLLNIDPNVDTDKTTPIKDNIVTKLKMPSTLFIVIIYIIF